MFVLFLVGIDVAILSTYTLVEGLQQQLTPSRIPNQESFKQTRGVSLICIGPDLNSQYILTLQKFQETFHYYILVCDSRSRLITLGFLYGYKALLQIVALVFAMSIRKVRIKGLNDAKYIIAAIYVTSIVTTLIFVSTYTLMKLPNVFAVVLSVCLFVGTTVIIGLVFIPPVSVMQVKRINFVIIITNYRVLNIICVYIYII